jgi:predicted Ser/Thr protein kinase
MAPDDDIDPRAVPVGTVIDGYTVTGKLGSGGMGEVYRVRRGGEDCALKLQGERLHDDMDPQRRGDLEARARREAAVLLSLRHPNILDIIGSGRWPSRSGYLYLVTELVHGQPLDVWSRRQRPSLRQLVSVFEQVADALDTMHRVGVFHRDIKDGNVLVRDDGRPVVIDLGIARSPAAYTLTRVGTVIGTTTHLSPGLCRYITGDKVRAYHFGPSDDLHALGYLLYERLTGNPPFRVRDDVELPELDYYHQVMEHVPAAPSALNSRVPEPLSALTMRLLAKTPEAGFASAADVRDALGAALAEAGPDWDAPFLLQRPGPDAGHAALPAPTRAVAANPGDTQEAIDALDGAGRAAPPKFVTPTPAAPVFHPPEGEAPAAATAPRPKGQFGETALRALGEQLRAPPPRRVGPLGFLFAGALLLVGGVVALRFVVPGRRPEPTALERYRAELASEQGSEAAVAPGPASAAGASGALTSVPVAAGAAEPSPPVGRATPAPEARPGVGDDAMPAALRAPATGSPPSVADEKAIRAELEQAYGAGRPTVPGKSHRPGTTKPSPSWVKGVEVVDAKTAAAEKRLGGRYGDHLRFQLRSNLDSRLCGSGTVEAVLVRPYLVDGAVVLPSRTLAFGQCSAQGGRFLVAFQRMRLPDGTEAAFEGLAMDVTDGKPGLLASRRVSATSSTSSRENVGGEIAKGAASTVLGAATGSAGLAGQVANSAGQTALNSRGEAPTTSDEALLLDAGAGIDVFVRQGF